MNKAISFLLDHVCIDEKKYDIVQITMNLFNFDNLRKKINTIFQAGDDLSDDVVLDYYTNFPEIRVVSPSNFFSEEWYRERYPDVNNAIVNNKIMSGFSHFLKFGLNEGRWPNSYFESKADFSLNSKWIDEKSVVNIKFNSISYNFLSAFSWIEPITFYNLYGRFWGCSIDIESSIVMQMRAEFDGDYYRLNYLYNDNHNNNPFDYYLEKGISYKHSPNSWFDEEWYQAFYADVRIAIMKGIFSCGFAHYLKAGRGEGRFPKFNLTIALEGSMPNVTKPILLERTEFLRDRMNRVENINFPLVSDQKKMTVWFVIPILNYDIAFGGYQACFALMVAINRKGYSIGIICMEEQVPNLEYFLWRTKDEELKKVLIKSEIIGRDLIDKIEININDRFIVYSVWDLAIAHKFASETKNKYPILIAQEYEPIFYDSGSLSAVCAEQYEIPHIALINSVYLYRFLLKNKIGVFGVNGGKYLIFNHKINILKKQSVTEMKNKKNRKFVIYSRPEGHASRNLFEIIVIALQQLCQNNLFSDNWEFIGIGSLSKIPDIYLGSGHYLRIHTKMSEIDYIESINNIDIGVSLMNAPHPSVVPFEFLTSGAIVITNTFENRSFSELKSISGNLIPCSPKISALKSAICEAIVRVEDFFSREKNIYKPETSSWEEIFTDTFVESMMVY
ncbi:rhamnosyltransferase WsaF family glycosyltransferase [Neokomagataea thailandica]|uniref:WsaF C-terminal domain-containing protein n=1 Tax=Neokomagataea tanensis NBRC 106556 TaxID=1223519 RepID=A0ABQ0QIG7_9PROT|nr:MULTISPECIES: hypothetical protein [Neokomagataea]GBR45991.1 hypothetical protein AA106556_0958 [Neokomagataea tanensis NBRC 106556]